MGTLANEILFDELKATVKATRQRSARAVSDLTTSGNEAFIFTLKAHKDRALATAAYPADTISDIEADVVEVKAGVQAILAKIALIESVTDENYDAVAAASGVADKI